MRLETIGPVGDRVVLEVGGDIDTSTAPRLRERLVSLADAGVLHVILDMSGVDFLDSTGLGVLVGGLKRQRLNGGSLVLVAGQERILRIFRITGLIAVFPIQPSASQAIFADPHWRQAIEEKAGGVEQWCREHGLA